MFFKAKVPECFDGLKELMEKIASRLDVFDFMSVLNIMRTYHKLNLSSDKLENAFVERIKLADIGEYRLKDISKICFFIGKLVLQSDNTKHILDMLSKEIMSTRYSRDRENFPLDILMCLNGMIVLDYYPQEMIQYCFERTVPQHEGMSRHIEKERL